MANSSCLRSVVIASVLGLINGSGHAQQVPHVFEDSAKARDQAQSHMENDEARKAVATLTEAARVNPRDRAVGALLYGCIRDHVWHLPQVLPIRHSAAVSVISFNPDATWLATGTESGEVLVSTTEPLDEQDAKELRVAFQHAGAIRGLFFSNDGGRLAVLAAEEGLKVWDLAKREAAFVAPRVGHPLTAWATRPGTNLAAFGTRAGAVLVVDIATGKTVGQWETSGLVAALAVSADGRRVAAATSDQVLRVWETESGKMLGEPTRRQGATVSLEFDADGSGLLVANATGDVTMLDPESKKPISAAISAGAELKKASLSPDGSRIALVLTDGSVSFWDAEAGQPLPIALREEGSFQDFRWSRTGLRAATASDSNHATVWDTRDGERWGEALPHEAPVLTLAYSNDGKLLATGCQDGIARVWRMDGGRAMPTVRSHFARARTAFYSLDGDHLLTTSDDHTALHWISGQVQPAGPALKHKGKVTCGVFDPEVARILTSDDTGIAQLWNADTGELDGQPYRHPVAVNWVDFHPDGQRFVAVSGSGAYIWSVANRGKPLAVIRHPGKARDELKCARFSPNGRWLVTASTDGTARIWDADTFRPIGQPIERGAPVLCVRFSPDSSRLVVAGEDSQAAVYLTRTWRLVGTPVLLPGQITSAAITVDNHFLVLTSFLLNAVQFFEIETGRAFGRGPFIPTQASCVDYHLQDQVVIVACDDGTVRAFGTPFVLQDIPGWACKFAERIAGYRKTGPESFERVESHYGQLANYLSGGARAGNASFAQLIRWKMTMGTGRAGMPSFVSTIAANIERRVEERSLDALYECYEAAPGSALVLGALSAYLPPGKQSLFLAEVVRRNKQAEPFAQALTSTAWLNAERPEEASAVMTEAVAAAPESPPVLRRNAKLHARLRHKQQAIAGFERLIVMTPNDYETRRSYGWALYNLDEPEKAAVQFRAAQKLLGDRDPDVVAGLCLCATAMRNKAEATATFRRLVLLEPDWKDPAYIASLSGWSPRELQALEAVRKSVFP